MLLAALARCTELQDAVALHSKSPSIEDVDDCDNNGDLVVVMIVMMSRSIMTSILFVYLYSADHRSCRCRDSG